MKKLLKTLFLLAAAACLLTGCSPRGKTSSSSPDPSPEVSELVRSEPYTIGLIQYQDYAPLNTAREAFLNRLDEWGYGEEKVVIDYQNAGGDGAQADAICRKFVEDKADMIVAISTPAAKAAVSAAEGTEIQVLFAAVDDPAADLGLRNLEQPEGNVTGACGSIPMEAVMDLALQANPGLKTLGLLYNPQEPSSAGDAARAKEYCEEKGIETVEAAVSQAEEAQQAAASLCGKADALFTPAGDGTVGASAGAVAEAARSAKTPWYVGVNSMVQEGALAAVSIDYAELGRKNADMAVELMEGKPVSQVPVYFFHTYETYINQKTLDVLGLSLPGEILETACFFS